MAKAPQFAWHVHHDVLLEPLWEPIERRQRHIREAKPPEEIEIRLKLLKPVAGALPRPVTEAAETVRLAYDKYGHSPCPNKGCQICTAENAYFGVLVANMPAILALHAKECPDCPWDGKTIFPDKEA